VHPFPPHWWGSVRSRKGLDCMRGLLSNSKNKPVLSTLFSANPKYKPMKKHEEN